MELDILERHGYIFVYMYLVAYTKDEGGI